ncbi:MAG: pitrilysin family protein, partial [Acidobacteriota bacterium]
GMAHLLEHMVFKGSPKHTNIPQELTEHGTRPNGSTWYDRTNYFETFAATDENLRWAFDLESDRMINSFIAKKDLDSEMTVVRNEFEMGENSPSNALIERIFSTAYIWHNYGKSTIGAKSDLENVPIDRLQAFYRRYYQPDNAVLLVAGKIDEGKTLELVQQYFGAIPRPTRVLPRIYTEDPVQDGERTVVVRRVGDTQLVASAYHVPPGAHPDAAAVSILLQIMSDTPSGRLHKALVETKKAASAFGFPYFFAEPNLFVVGAEVRLESPVEPARDGLLDVIENVGKSPITKEEVERARAQMLKQIELNLNSSEQVGLELSEWVGMGDWRLLFINRDRLRKVSAEDVQRVATAYLKPSNRTLGLFVPTPKPDRAEVPSVPDVVAMVKNYKGDVAIATGEAFDPSPSNIESRTTRNAVGGIKLALLPKKTRGNTVVANLILHLGDEKSLMNRDTAGSLAASMLMRGTSKRTRQQIQDELDKLKARVSVSGGPTAVNVTIETVRDNLPAVVKLVGEVLRDPSFPAGEFDQLRQEELAGIEQSRSEPTNIGFIEFQRHTRPYPKGHVNYVSTPAEGIADLKAVTLDEVKKFYKDFYGAQQGEFSVVGDFNEGEVAKLTADVFGGWKAPQPFVRIGETYRDVQPLNKALETPDKANAFFIAGLNVKLRDDDPDYPALVLGNYMLGGGFLNSRLAARIRGKDGLSYNVGSQVQASSLDQSGLFLAFAIYAPQNVTKLEAAFKEEIAKAIKDGFTEEEIKAAKSGWLQSRQVSRAQDNELAGRLRNFLYINRTLAWDSDFEARVGALTAAQITAAIRKFIDPTKISIIKAGDFAKSMSKAGQ